MKNQGEKETRQQGDKVRNKTEVKDKERDRKICKQGGDSNDKQTAMRSWSMARNQCWATVSKRAAWLSAPDVNSTGNNQP